MPAGAPQAIGLGSALTAHPHIDPPAASRSARLALWKWQRCGSMKIILLHPATAVSCCALSLLAPGAASAWRCRTVRRALPSPLCFSGLCGGAVCLWSSGQEPVCPSTLCAEGRVVREVQPVPLHGYLSAGLGRVLQATKERQLLYVKGNCCI